MVKQLHALKIDPTKFHDKFNPLFYRMFPVNLAQPFVKPIRHCIIFKSKIHGMMRIRRHPLEAKQKCRAERDDIICSLPQRYNRNLIFSNFFLLFLNAAGKFFNRLIIKIYICQCRKQSVHQKAVCFFRMLSVFFGRFRQLNKFIHQLILQFRRLRLFATDSGIDTTFISGGLLALKTKHI